MNNIETQSKSSKKTRKKYEKPTIDTETLNTYGAVCNGMSTGGRKATTLPPTPCNASKINS